MTARRLVAAICLALVATAAAAAVTQDDLFIAATVDNLRDVRRIIQTRAADPTRLDARGDTLLIAAIRNDAARVTDFLIAEPAIDLEATNVSNETALMIAAYRRKKDVVDRLIARGAEVNRKGWTALHYAASVDAGDIVASLLDHAAYIDAESPNRTTPLMMAARGGFEALCRQLIDAGADPTPINERDVTAADFARKAGSDDLAAWLDSQSVAWRAKYGTSPAGAPARRP